jgi:hypothetical protein
MLCVTDIDFSKVTAVLLADKWYTVMPGSFFRADFTFTEPGDKPGFSPEKVAIPGFRFSEPMYSASGGPLVATRPISGQLSAIVAYRYADEEVE